MKTIRVFTDGSYIRKKKDEQIKIYCGYGIFFPDAELPNVSEPLVIKKLTNNRAELFAVYTALTMITKLDKFDKITIYSDSEYVIKSMTEWIKKWRSNGWKKSNNKMVDNLDLILLIDKMMDNVEFIHVVSHTDKKDEISKYNKIVDGLAKKGALSKENINRK